MEPKKHWACKEENGVQHIWIWIFLKICWYCHIFEKKQHLKYLDSADVFFCLPLLAFLPKTEHLKKSRSLWFDTNLQQIHDWWSPSATRDAIGTPDGIPSIEFWQPAWGGNFGQVASGWGKKKLHSKDVVLFKDIWEFFFIWRMRKTSRFRFFSLKSTKAYPIQSCIGAVQEVQSIVEAWIASKRLQCLFDEVVQQVVSISQRLCRFAYSFYIIIVFNTTIQSINLSLLPGWMFPSSISLGSTFAEAQSGSGRHDKRWKTNLWGKEVIRTFLSKGDYGMPSKTFQYHTLKFQ